MANETPISRNPGNNPFRPRNQKEEEKNKKAIMAFLLMGAALWFAFCYLLIQTVFPLGESVIMLGKI